MLTVWRNEVDPFDEAAGSTCSPRSPSRRRSPCGTSSSSPTLENRSAELGRKVEQLEALAEVGEAISSSLDADEVLATIVSHAVDLSDTDGGSLMEFDRSTGLFRVRTAYGTSEDVIEALRAAEIHIDRTWVGRAARGPGRCSRSLTSTRSPCPSTRTSRCCTGPAGARSSRSRSCVPTASSARSSSGGSPPGSFSEETCELLAAFASQSAVALTNARLYQQLERQSVELAEASRHKSEFLASMSHELRTPLNAVIGFSEVLLERMFGDLNERQEDYLQDIHAAGRHLLALLGDILDLSKIEAGRMELDLTTFPIDDLVVQALSLVRERAAGHGIRLTLDAERGLGTVTADALRLKQVLLNLLSNAVKFTPDGGSVDVRAWREHEEVAITVTDTGIGIDPADQERIFDSFQQGERSASSSEGTGLGLTLSRRIVELHGGRLWLTSAPGEGSTFGISIPQPSAAPPSDGPAWSADLEFRERPGRRRHRGRPALRRARRAAPACGRAARRQRLHR